MFLPFSFIPRRTFFFSGGNFSLPLDCLTQYPDAFALKPIRLLYGQATSQKCRSEQRQRITPVSSHADCNAATTCRAAWPGITQYNSEREVCLAQPSGETISNRFILHLYSRTGTFPSLRVV